MNTPLIATIENEGDKVIKVKVRFNHNKIDIYLKDNPLLNSNQVDD